MPMPHITANNLINRMHKKGARQIVVPLVFSWNYESMQLSVQWFEESAYTRERKKKQKSFTKWNIRGLIYDDFRRLLCKRRFCPMLSFQGLESRKRFCQDRRKAPSVIIVGFLITYFYRCNGTRDRTSEWIKSPLQSSAPPE